MVEYHDYADARAVWGDYDIDTLRPFPATARRYGRTGSYGFRSAERGVVVPPIYNYLPEKYNAAYMIAKVDKDTYRLIDGYGRRLGPEDYASLTRLPKRADEAVPGLLAARNKNRRSYVLTARGEPFEPINRYAPFGNIESYRGRYVRLTKRTDRRVTVNLFYDIERGAMLTESPARHYAALNGGGLALQTLDDGVLILNAAGERTVEEDYDDFRRLEFVTADGKEEFLTVVRDDLHGLIRPDGELILPLEYTEPNTAGNALILKKPTGKTGLYDPVRGEWILTPDYLHIESARRGTFLRVSGVGGVGAYTLAGKEILPPDFRQIEEAGPRALLAYGTDFYGQLYGRDGRRLSEETYAEVRSVNLLLGRATGYAGLISYTPEAVRALNGQRPPKKYALVSLVTGERLSGYVYDRVRSEGRGDRKRVVVERDGLRGTVNNRGKENNDFVRIK